MAAAETTDFNAEEMGDDDGEFTMAEIGSKPNGKRGRFATRGEGDGEEKEGSGEEEEEGYC